MVIMERLLERLEAEIARQLNRRPPAEADMRDYFGVTPPTVHQMVLQLEKHGLIRRRLGQPRSIELLVAPEAIPPLR